jgi:pimeloyl-ACP methyl ester carboxylesterase
MSTFLLVSGAWHAAWCWERIVPMLQERGHKVIAPDLLGMGPEPTPLAHVTLARWADQVADIIRSEAEPIVLVGHSRGGIVISETAERVPEKIARLVYLAAFMIPDGATLLGSAGGRESTSAGGLQVGPDNTTTVTAENVANTFYNTTPPEWVQRASSLVSAEPMVVFTTPLKLSEAGFGRVPRGYIECTEDRAVTPDLQRGFQARLPCDVVVTLNTDHSPFYSAPEALVEALEQMAAATQH